MKRLSTNLLLVVGAFLVISIIIMALLAPVIAPYDPIDDANLIYSREPPSKKFPLGTDRQGRDIFSRIVFGARISLMIGVLTQALNTFIGVALGLIAGYSGGALDDLIMGFTNIMLTLPSLILALVITAALGPGLINIFIALGFTLWTYTCRVTRGQTLSVKEKEFVEAARAAGATKLRIISKHIFPHVLSPVLVIATLGVGTAILLEASLSFLGVGTQPPTPSWGLMLSQGRLYMFNSPWIMIFPGLAIFITILGFNLIGDGLRDILDPRTQRESEM